MNIDIKPHLSDHIYLSMRMLEGIGKIILFYSGIAIIQIPITQKPDYPNKI